MADLGGGHGRARACSTPIPSRGRARASRSGCARVERVIGACPPRDEVVRHPAGAWASPWTTPGADLEVVVPSFRRDIAQEDDLVEEIIRVWGYDKIPVTLARGGELQPGHAAAPGCAWPAR